MKVSESLLTSIRTEVSRSQEIQRKKSFYRDPTPSEKCQNSRLSSILSKIENLPQIESLKGRQMADLLSSLHQKRQR
jgi:hypothetical protein